MRDSEWQAVLPMLDSMERYELMLVLAYASLDIPAVVMDEAIATVMVGRGDEAQAEVRS